MPRDLPLGNGRLLVNFDARYQMRDLYFPHVGKENHTTGHPFRFGVWVDGQFSWVHEDGWQRRLAYRAETLVTEVVLEHEGLELRLICRDAVDFHLDVYVREIELHNLAPRDREVRLFFAHDFHIRETADGDTAYFRPEERALIHYKSDRYFLISCCKGERCGLDQFATGLKEHAGAEGTWRDAEDGQLGGNPIAQGSVDSTVGFSIDLSAGGVQTVHYWIAAAESYRQVKSLNALVVEKRPDELVRRTANYWRSWANKEEFDFADLPAPLVEQFKRSLLVIRTQIDGEGAVIAANDSDITQFGRDTYSYMWPRDGALVAYALDLAGYVAVTQKFFEFCNRVITKEGYFLHKYNPDGTLGSPWHPWMKDSEYQVPIQEDETGLVLWVLWHHFDKFRDIESLKPQYRNLVVRAADFMCMYRDPSTGLPLPSYDLWEERRGVLAFTCAAVYAGLQAAQNLAVTFGETHLAEKYAQACEEIKAGVEAYLWRPELGRFARMMNFVGDKALDVDVTIDSSLYGLFAFGMYDAADPKIVATMEAVRQRLRVQTAAGGLARYEDDGYHRVNADVERVPGNPWFICTLWLAQWYVAKARSEEDLKPALDILNWAVEHALPSGVLAEQVDPLTHAPVSVSPLTWSHATFSAATLEYLDKKSELGTCEACGQRTYHRERRRLSMCRHADAA